MNIVHILLLIIHSTEISLTLWLENTFRNLTLRPVSGLNGSAKLFEFTKIRALQSFCEAKLKGYPKKISYDVFTR